jgi:hypothetical protein
MFSARTRQVLAILALQNEEIEKIFRIVRPILVSSLPDYKNR